MKKFIKLLVLLAIMYMIFFLSDQPGSETIVTTNGLIELIYNLFIKYFNITLEDFGNFIFYPLRTFAHFMEFLLLGVVVYLNSVEYFKTNATIYAHVFTYAYAISDEIHQLFVVNRYCDLKDMAVDMLGGFVGIYLVHRIYLKWIKKN